MGWLFNQQNRLLSRYAVVFAQDFPHKGKDGKNKKKEKALADCTVRLTQGLVEANKFIHVL